MFHTGKVLLSVKNRRLVGKLDDTIEKEQFGFRRRVGTEDVFGLLRSTGERKTYVFYIYVFEKRSTV